MVFPGASHLYTKYAVSAPPGDQSRQVDDALSQGSRDFEARGDKTRDRDKMIQPKARADGRAFPDSQLPAGPVQKDCSSR